MYSWNLRDLDKWSYGMFQGLEEVVAGREAGGEEVMREKKIDIKYEYGSRMIILYPYFCNNILSMFSAISSRTSGNINPGLDLSRSFSLLYPPPPPPFLISGQ